MRLIKLFVFVVLFLISISSVSAQETLEAIVTKVIEDKTIILDGFDDPQLYQKLQLKITKGSNKNDLVIVENGSLPSANIQKYQINDRVTVISDQGTYLINDYLRRQPLLILTLIFVFLVILVSKQKGLTSLLGLAFSFLTIFYFILPKILSGSNPIFITMIGSLIIIPVSFYISHGFNRKTTTAIIGTFISLVITGIISKIFIDLTRLTGFASEEAGFLQVIKQGNVNMVGILLAGIIVGALGVLDDITISQASVVFQLKQANDKLKFNQLFSQAMSVGHDHISSMVNTLFLAYAGASMPLLLLFVNNPHPFSEVINYEIVADEIVRTLVGSIGLILAVPITTFIAAYCVNRK